MCNCGREYLNVDVRRLNVDADTKMRLSRFARVDITRDDDGVVVEADGLRVSAPDGIQAVKMLAALSAGVEA